MTLNHDFCSIFQGVSVSGVKSRIQTLFEKLFGFIAYVFWRNPWTVRLRFLALPLFRSRFFVRVYKNILVLFMLFDKIQENVKNTYLFWKFLEVRRFTRVFMLFVKMQENVKKHVSFLEVFGSPPFYSCFHAF